MLQYPFTSALDIMKPSKIDKDKPSHVKQLAACMKSAEYIWEEKLDGISILGIEGRLFSNKIAKATGWPGEKTMKMPQVSRHLTKIGGKLILDGEAYRPGWKSNDVTSITNSEDMLALTKQGERGQLQYWVYDMLRDLDGTWMVNWPFEQRRARMEELFANELAEQTDIILNAVHDVSTEDPQEALTDILSRGLEGIVLKSKSGTYQPGKRPMWNQVKCKASMDDDVVITGFEAATRRYLGKNLDSWLYWEDGEPVTSNYARGLIGSITIGKYDSNGTLVNIGKVTGITDTMREEMTTCPQNYIGLVIIIRAMEQAENGKYRHANFRSFHPDKNPKECKIIEND